MDDERDNTGEVLDALRAWLLAEDAYERGGVPDEVLNYLQDRISHLLGSRATFAAGDFLKGGNYADVARDREKLIELLAVIEGKRRRGFEFQWRAFPRPPLVDDTTRPTALLVMAEYGVEDPVWDRPSGHGGEVTLTELGVSQSLVRRLREWNEAYERAEADAAWVEQGLLLAQELQRELPDLDVRYYHADDDRPLRSLPATPPVPPDPVTRSAEPSPARPPSD